MTTEATDKGRALRRRLVGGALALSAVLIALWTLPLAEWLDAARVWIAAHPVPGRALFVLALALATVLMVPGSFLAMSAGYLFGLWPGVALASIGTTLGALAACLAGRTLARPLVADAMAGNPRLGALDSALERRGFLVVVLTRLSLLLPYNLLNYAYGLTAIRLRTYVPATLLGMLPALTLYGYLGTLADDVQDVVAGDPAQGVSGMAVTGIGLVALVLAVYVVHRTATAELKKHMKKD